MPGFQTPQPIAVSSPGTGGPIGSGRQTVNSGADIERSVGNGSGIFPDPTVRIPISIASTLITFIVRVDANTLNGNLVIDVLRNGVSWGGGSLTYGAGATGIMSIPVAVVGVVVGDGISFRMDATAAGAGSATGVQCEVQYNSAPPPIT